MGILNLTVCLLLIIALADAKLQCSSTCVSDKTVEGAVVNLTCHGKYSGSPALTWYVTSDKSVPPWVPGQVRHGDITSRNMTWNAVPPSLVALTCEANLPNDKCETKECNILYSPRNVITSPLLLVSPEEEITCKAEGNPEPKFYWQVKGEDGTWLNIPGSIGETIEAPQLNNDTSSIELRCVAWNQFTVAGVLRTHEKHSVPVFVSKDGALIRNAIIGSVVAVVVIAIIVVGIIQCNCPGVLPWN